MKLIKLFFLFLLLSCFGISMESGLPTPNETNVPNNKFISKYQKLKNLIINKGKPTLELKTDSGMDTNFYISLDGKCISYIFYEWRLGGYYRHKFTECPENEDLESFFCPKGTPIFCSEVPKKMEEFEDHCEWFNRNNCIINTLTKSDKKRILKRVNKTLNLNKLKD